MFQAPHIPTSTLLKEMDSTLQLVLSIITLVVACVVICGFIFCLKSFKYNKVIREKAEEETDQLLSSDIMPPTRLSLNMIQTQNNIF